MNGIREWAFSACAAMAVCGIARMVLPAGNLQKVLNITISVFFMCCLLSPLALRTGGNIELNWYSQEESEKLAQQLMLGINAQANNAAEAAIEKIISEKLLDMGINHTGITININTNGQNDAQIENINIRLPEEYEERNTEIQDRLENAMGMKIQLVYD